MEENCKKIIKTYYIYTDCCTVHYIIIQLPLHTYTAATAYVQYTLMLIIIVVKNKNERFKRVRLVLC